jgi:hypothetical protein
MTMFCDSTEFELYAFERRVVFSYREFVSGWLYVD